MKSPPVSGVGGAARSASAPPTPPPHSPVTTTDERFIVTTPEPESGAPPPAAGEPALVPPEPGVLQTIGIRYVLKIAARSLTPSARDRVIREDLGISPTAYFQLLNALLDSVDSLKVDPVTVYRLRRIRDSRRAAREGESP